MNIIVSLTERVQIEKFTARNVYMAKEGGFCRIGTFLPPAFKKVNLRGSSKTLRSYSGDGLKTYS